MPKNPVTITFSGDKQVIKNILKKKKLLAKNDPTHKKIKTVLLLPGGGQEGVIEGGVCIALEKLELIDAFDQLVGASTGAGAGYYTVAKEAAIGASIYFDDNVKNHFISFLRLWKIMDIDEVENVFRNVKPINLETFLSSRTTFLVGITDQETGVGRFVDAKAFGDPLSCVVASICFPVADGGKVVALNKKLYVDGALSNPLPITWIIENLHPTDILIVLPEPLTPKKDFFYKLISASTAPLPKILNKNLRHQFATFLERFNAELAYLIGKREIPKGIHIGVIHPKQRSIKEVTMSRYLLQEAALSAMNFTKNLFSA